MLFAEAGRSLHPEKSPSATLTISQAAELLGIGRNLAYETAARDGELAGVPVIRVGRRMVVPRARLLLILGLRDASGSVGT